MKKYSLFFCIVCLVWMHSVEAFECVYDVTLPAASSVDSAETTTISVIKESDSELTYETDSEEFKFVKDEVYLLDTYIDSQWSESKIIELMSDKCSSGIYICKGGKENYQGSVAGDLYGVILNPDLYNSILDKSYISWTLYSEYSGLTAYFPIDSCTPGTINEGLSIGTITDDIFPCKAYETFWGEVEEKYCDKDTENCSLNEINDYNTAKEKLINYCQHITEYADFINPCLKTCIGLPEAIANLEGKESNIGQCGFSGRLILFIANIIRWVKYIIPVAVIILGILDFIKAIGADKEDEMKKAQQRFIKRLIAAVLIFIIPFILEFVLNKMGFNAMGCGIINL